MSLHRDQESNSDPPMRSAAPDPAAARANHAEEDARMIQDMFAGHDDAELEAVTAARRDIYGSLHYHHSYGNSVEHNPNIPKPPTKKSEIRTARQRVREAIAALPASRRRIYDAAVEMAPHLVQMEESPPELFLWASQQNYWRAAERIVDYWQKRLEFFGESFCLPMTLSGSGAMSMEVVQAMRESRMHMILPPDKCHRPVLLVDRDRGTSDVEETSARAQIYLYLLHVLSESELALKNGFVIVLCFESGQNRNKSKPNGDTLRLFQSELIPIKVLAIHMISNGFPSFIQTLWLPILRNFQSLMSFLEHRIEMTTPPAAMKIWNRKFSGFAYCLNMIFDD